MKIVLQNREKTLPRDNAYCSTRKTDRDAAKQIFRGKRIKMEMIPMKREIGEDMRAEDIILPNGAAITTKPIFSAMLRTVPVINDNSQAEVTAAIIAPDRDEEARMRESPIKFTSIPGWSRSDLRKASDFLDMHLFNLREMGMLQSHEVVTENFIVSYVQISIQRGILKRDQALSVDNFLEIVRNDIRQHERNLASISGLVLSEN